MAVKDPNKKQSGGNRGRALRKAQSMVNRSNPNKQEENKPQAQESEQNNVASASAEKKGEVNGGKAVEKAIDTAKKVKKLSKNTKWLKFLGPAMIVIVIIILLIGLLSFITNMPDMVLGKLTEYLNNSITSTAVSWGIGKADMLWAQKNVTKTATYLENMGYDLLGYGFLEEVKLDGNGDIQDSNPADYYIFTLQGNIKDSKTGERDLYYGTVYYNSLEVGTYKRMIGVRDDYIVEVTFNDKFKVNTEIKDLIVSQFSKEVGRTNSFPAEEQIVVTVRKSMDSDTYEAKVVLCKIKGKTYYEDPSLTEEEKKEGTKEEYISSEYNEINYVESELLLTYLATEARTYMVRNTNIDWFGQFLNWFRSFRGEETSDPGMINLMEKAKGLDGIKVERDSRTLFVPETNGEVAGYKYAIDGWLGKYGRPLEFSLALHLSTMAPELAYKVATDISVEAQVYLEVFEGKIGKEAVTADGQSAKEVYAKKILDGIDNFEYSEEIDGKGSIKGYVATWYKYKGGNLKFNTAKEYEDNVSSEWKQSYNGFKNMSDGGIPFFGANYISSYDYLKEFVKVIGKEAKFTDLFSNADFSTMGEYDKEQFYEKKEFMDFAQEVINAVDKYEVKVDMKVPKPDGVKAKGLTAVFCKYLGIAPEKVATAIKAGDAEEYQAWLNAYEGEIQKLSTIGVEKISNITREIIKTAGLESVLEDFEKIADYATKYSSANTQDSNQVLNIPYIHSVENHWYRELYFGDPPMPEGYIVKIDETGAAPIVDMEGFKKIVKAYNNTGAQNNFLRAADSFMKAQEDYKVNAIFMMAISIIEQSGGTANSTCNNTYKNWYSYSTGHAGSWRDCTADGDGGTYFVAGRIAQRNNGDGYDYFMAKRYSVNELGKNYCDPPDSWIKNMNARMYEFYKYAIEHNIPLYYYTENGLVEATGFVPTKEGLTRTSNFSVYELVDGGSEILPMEERDEMLLSLASGELLNIQQRLQYNIKQVREPIQYDSSSSIKEIFGYVDESIIQSYARRQMEYPDDATEKEKAEIKAENTKRLNRIPEIAAATKQNNIDPESNMVAFKQKIAQKAKYYIFDGSGRSAERLNISPNAASLSALAILEAVHTEDAEHILKNLKELYSDLSFEMEASESSDSATKDQKNDSLNWIFESYIPAYDWPSPDETPKTKENTDLYMYKVTAMKQTNNGSFANEQIDYSAENVSEYVEGKVVFDYTSSNSEYGFLGDDTLIAPCEVQIKAINREQKILTMEFKKAVKTVSYIQRRLTSDNRYELVDREKEEEDGGIVGLTLTIYGIDIGYISVGDTIPAGAEIGKTIKGQDIGLMIRGRDLTSDKVLESEDTVSRLSVPRYIYPPKLVEEAVTDYIVKTGMSESAPIITNVNDLVNVLDTYKDKDKKRTDGKYEKGYGKYELNTKKIAVELLRVQEKYGINAIYLASASIYATGGGRSMPYQYNFLNIRNGDNSDFPDLVSGWDFVGKYISENYFPEGKTTVTKIRLKWNAYLESRIPVRSQLIVKQMTEFFMAAAEQGVSGFESFKPIISESNSSYDGETFTSSYGATFRLYKQGYLNGKKTKWADIPYWNGTIASEGCGPTSVAMILTAYGNDVYPNDIAKKMVGNTSNTLMKSTLEKYGIDSDIISAPARQTIISHLKSGRPMLISVDKTFTSNTHIMALLDIRTKGSDYEVFVANPSNTGGEGWKSLDIVYNACRSRYVMRIKNDNYVNIAGETVSTSGYFGGNKVTCTWFKDATLASGITRGQMKYNSSKGWWEYKGQIVVATASDRLKKYLVGGPARPDIHYFNLYDTLELKIDGTWYKAIVLDVCGISMNPDYDTRYGHYKDVVSKTSHKNQVVDILRNSGDGKNLYNVEYRIGT